MRSPMYNYAQIVNILNPFQPLCLASSDMQKILNIFFFLTLKKTQYLSFPPLKKINFWQLSYIFAMFLISLCFWHCQHILQYAAVPLIIFWNSLTRNASSQRIELTCIIYTVYRVMSFEHFPVFYCWYFFSDGLYSCEKCPNFVTHFTLCFTLTYFGWNIADGTKKSIFLVWLGLLLLFQLSFMFCY